MANFFVDSLCPVSHPSSQVSGANSNQPNPFSAFVSWSWWASPGCKRWYFHHNTSIARLDGTDIFFKKSIFPDWPDTDNLWRLKLTVDKINPCRPSQPSQPSSIPSTPIWVSRQVEGRCQCHNYQMMKRESRGGSGERRGQVIISVQPRCKECGKQPALNNAHH